MSYRLSVSRSLTEASSWRRQGILPPFKKIANIEGLTGEQLLSLLNQRAEKGDTPQ
jgi:hypothetical protein